MNAPIGVVGVGEVSMVVVPQTAYLVQAGVTIPPSGYVVPTAWRAVAGATGARVGSAILTVDPVTYGAGRDAGVVAAGKNATTSIAVTPPDARVPTRGLTLPSLRSAPDGEALPLSDDLHLVVHQGGTPVVAVPPLPADHYVPAQLTGGALSGSALTLPDLVGPLSVTLAAGRTLDELTSLSFAHGDVRLKAAPMPVGLHVVGPDGDEQLAVPGPLRTTLTHDLAPALQRHLAAAVVDQEGGTAPVTLRSDATGDAYVRLAVTGLVIERAIEGRPSVECDGAPTSVPRPGVTPGRAPTHTRADVIVTHHGAALHPSSDPVPAADADVGGVAVRDVGVTRRIPAATLAGEHLVRVAVVGWPHGETDLALGVAGASLTASALPGADGRGAPSVVWFTLPTPAAVDGPVDVTLRATRGAFRWFEPADGSGPALRLAVASSPVGTRVVVGGVGLDLTGETTTTTGVLLAGTDGWAVETDQLCTVALANAVMEFAP
ncbi:hypothetical protein [Cellulomonas persica]|uniref:Uncharacterized protein n=1 Tax=Cellulomonas persica TaxID=76861 RepID=A0A510UW59_9CELL|nr:hypothetical protein [Cellulomonas persica]GEK17731.1 hypothetical protein CPE01_14640 [Cellulomonas persica]